MKPALTEGTLLDATHTAGEVCLRLLVRGEHLSAVVLMSTIGVLDCKVINQSANGDLFYDIIQCTLLPHLMPYNGSNPHSIVVMDNASIYHSDGIQDLICGTGVLLIYLPPYSPDYNPIEELFSKLKTVAKGYEQDRQAGH